MAKISGRKVWRGTKKGCVFVSGVQWERCWKDFCALRLLGINKMKGATEWVGRGGESCPQLRSGMGGRDARAGLALA